MQKNFTNNTRLNHFHLYLLEVLKDLRNKVPDEFASVLSFPAPIIYLPVLNKFGWFVLSNAPSVFNLPKLSLFHYLLIQPGFITCTYEEFEIHFIREDKLPEKRIVWKGDIMVLVLLFDVLMNEKRVIPPVNRLYDILPDHFVWSDVKTGKIKELRRGSLKSSLSAARKNPAVVNIVKNLVTLLLSKM